MCFSSQPKPPPVPASAPAPPSPTAEAQPVTGPRANIDLQLYGTSQPTTRVDRSQTAAGVGAGGSGLNVSS